MSQVSRYTAGRPLRRYARADADRGAVSVCRRCARRLVDCVSVLNDAPGAWQSLCAFRIPRPARARACVGCRSLPARATSEDRWTLIVKSRTDLTPIDPVDLSVDLAGIERAPESPALLTPSHGGPDERVEKSMQVGLDVALDPGKGGPRERFDGHLDGDLEQQRRLDLDDTAEQTASVEVCLDLREQGCARFHICRRSPVLPDSHGRPVCTR